MGWLTLAGQIFKVVCFFLDLWKEKDQEKAQKKAKVGERIVNAFAETNKKRRASRINGAIGAIKRV